jgi:hypothetical protein
VSANADSLLTVQLLLLLLLLCTPSGHPDGDGQYFHYLTKWAFALAAMTQATGDTKYLSWALELVQRVHPAFVYTVSGHCSCTVRRCNYGLHHRSMSD